MTVQLHESVFVVEPQACNAVLISKAYREKTFESFEHVASTVNRVLKRDQQRTLALLAEISSSSVTSLFYVLNAKIVRALKERRDLEGVIHTLERFSSLPTSELISFSPNISNLNKNEWALEFAAEIAKDANRINGDGYAELIPVSVADFEENYKMLTHALAIIKSSHLHSFYDELVHYVSDIILFDGKGVTGGSSTRTMGSIFIRIPNNRNMSSPVNSMSLSLLPPLVYYVEQLVHETAHLHLDQLMEFDPIVLNKPSDLFASPIRKDPRPMRGVFHATFVLARLVRFFSDLEFLDEHNETSKKRRLHIVHVALKKGLKVIGESGEFTERGFQLFQLMEGIHKKAKSYDLQ